jgi:hypothetical protein
VIFDSWCVFLRERVFFSILAAIFYAAHELMCSLFFRFLSRPFPFFFSALCMYAYCRRFFSLLRLRSFICLVVLGLLVRKKRRWSSAFLLVAAGEENLISVEKRTGWLAKAGLYIYVLGRCICRVV